MKLVKTAIFGKMKSVKGKNGSTGNSNNDLNYQQLWDLKLFGRGIPGVLDLCQTTIESKKRNPFWIATVNPEFVMAAEKDKKFKEILHKTDLNTIDGVGLVWALKGGNFKTGIEILQGKHREIMATGADLVVELSKLAAERGWSVYFLGGWGDRAQRTAKYLKNRFKIQDSRFKIETCEGNPKVDDATVVKKINEFKPDLLFVAYGMKKQEEWIEKYLDKLEVKVVMGVGRTFDYLSGDLKRAPEVYRKLGFEWLYSLAMEPKRIIRQTALIKFVFRVLLSHKVND